MGFKNQIIIFVLLLPDFRYVHSRSRIIDTAAPFTLSACPFSLCSIRVCCNPCCHFGICLPPLTEQKVLSSSLPDGSEKSNYAHPFFSGCLSPANSVFSIYYANDEIFVVRYRNWGTGLFLKLGGSRGKGLEGGVVFGFYVDQGGKNCEGT